VFYEHYPPSVELFSMRVTYQDSFKNSTSKRKSIICLYGR
ncbi:unnamed protein product, partial [marine sediment metagenome]